MNFGKKLIIAGALALVCIVIANLVRCAGDEHHFNIIWSFLAPGWVGFYIGAWIGRIIYGK